VTKPTKRSFVNARVDPLNTVIDNLFICSYGIQTFHPFDSFRGRVKNVLEVSSELPLRAHLSDMVYVLIGGTTIMYDYRICCYCVIPGRWYFAS
jgi:hypothetical protein